MSDQAERPTPREVEPIVSQAAATDGIVTAMAVLGNSLAKRDEVIAVLSEDNHALRLEVVNLRRMLDEAIELATQQEPDEPAVEGDPEQNGSGHADVRV